MRASFLYIVVFSPKIIKFICRFFGFSRRAPYAARSDCVRRPIGFRSPSDRIAFAARRLFLRLQGETTNHL